MKLWTREEDSKLLGLIKQGLTTDEMATQMGRSFKSVQHRRAWISKGKEVTYSNLVEPKEKKQNLSALIIQSLKEELSKATPYERTKKDNLIKRGDTLVVHFTDWHIGKVIRDEDGTELYNTEIFKKRINLLLEEILTLLDEYIIKGTPIKDVAILSTGDILDGMGIYSTQETQSEMSPPFQVMLAVEVIQKFILALLKRNLQVNFYGIKGNHGEIRGEGGKQKDPNANWDLQLYLILDFWAKAILKQKIAIYYSELDYLNFELQGWKYHIRHIAPQQSETPSGKAKFLGWARKHKCNVIVSGHYHHFSIADRSGVTIIKGGSISGEDELSERMAEESDPIQLLWGVSKHRPTTFMYEIDLGERKRK